MAPGKVIEKKIVREAFADMLPESVAWRQKEQFSDGVGYSWIDTLKAITSAAVTDHQIKKNIITEASSKNTSPVHRRQEVYQVYQA